MGGEETPVQVREARCHRRWISGEGEGNGGGVVYSYEYLGKITGYDPTEEWMQVKELPMLCGATLADLGGCCAWCRKRKPGGE